MKLLERWFSALTTKKFQRSAHNSVTALADAICAWNETCNANPKPFVWHKGASRDSPAGARYCAVINKR